MAVTKIWKVSNKLERVIDYVTDKNKTIEDRDLINELHNNNNVNNSDEEECFVSGINCSVDNAYKDMMMTKKVYKKEKGVLAYHAYQSFEEGEVTPEQAHEIGLKLADEMWGDRFEVIVTTHLNTKHYHNHFVINSVSFMDGRKYSDNRESYAELRHISDCLCQEYGLSCLEEKETKKGHNYDNYYKSNIEKSTYHSIAKSDIDRAIKLAYSYADFERIMRTMNYDLMYRAGKLSIRKYSYRKNIRVLRAFGENYSLDRIKERIKHERFETKQFISKTKNKEEPPFFSLQNSSLYKKYIHYCYLLKIYPKKYPHKWVSPEIRAEVKRLDMLSDEMKLLVRNNIKTNEQFFVYQRGVNSELNSLVDQRNKLWYQYKNSDDEVEQEFILKQIDELSPKIKRVRKEVILCRDIELRTPKMEENLTEYEKEQKRLIERKVKNYEL